LEVRDARLSTVLPLLEQKGKIRLMYGEEVDQLDQAITLAVSDTPVLEVLEHVLRNTDLEFVTLDGDLVVIKKRGTGQPTPVRGTVRNAEGSPLSGVSVAVKGTSTGGSTDDEGRFTIEAPANGVLVFTYIGYTAQEVTLNGQSTLDITLQADEQELGEVVVTALGIQRENRKIGYSASTVNVDQLSQNRTTNVGNSLTGRVAGLNVAGAPTGAGGSARIRLRGQASFGGNNSPLIIVNGVPINNAIQSEANGAGGGNAGEANTDLGDGLQSISPDDIASMTVLKGAAAAALYGFRAKDGAIIIQTKSGKSQDNGIGVSFSSSYQAAQPLDYTDFQYEYGQGENG